MASDIATRKSDARGVLRGKDAAIFKTLSFSEQRTACFMGMTLIVMTIVTPWPILAEGFARSGFAAQLPPFFVARGAQHVTLLQPAHAANRRRDQPALPVCCRLPAVGIG